AGGSTAAGRSAAAGGTPRSEPDQHRLARGSADRPELMTDRVAAQICCVSHQIATTSGARALKKGPAQELSRKGLRTICDLKPHAAETGLRASRCFCRRSVVSARLPRRSKRLPSGAESLGLGNSQRVGG